MANKSKNHEAPHKIILPTFAISIVLLLGLAVFASVFEAKQANNQQVSTQKHGPTPAYAPDGKIVDGFPTELVLGATTSVQQSYSLTYSDKQKQFSTVMDSTAKPDTIYAQYKKFFQQNGWTIVNDVSKGIYSLAATKANDQALFVVTTQDSKTQVNISYLKNQ